LTIDDFKISSIWKGIFCMPFADQRFFNRQSPIVNRQLLILILLVLPLTACGRYKARKALQKIQYFAEILKREDLRAIGEDGFFKDNLTGNRDPEVRRWCAIALGRIADPRALPLLYGALHTGDAEVRAASAFAIGEIEDRELLDLRCSVPDPRAQFELFRLLDDSSITVRMRAIEALGKTGSHAEAANIVRRLEHFSYSGSAFENAYLSAAITALSRLGDPAAIPFLERLAGVRDPEIQQRALEARMRVQTGASSPQPANTAQNPDAASLSPCGTKAPVEPAAGSITDAVSYALAAYRKNSTIAQIETTRGTIEIELFREDAPVTAERFVAMAKRGVYNDTEFTKTTPFEVIESGNPMGWPGLSRTIRSEVNMRPFERGSIGMALSGADSDAGKFFIALAPQPYLDGINTCFGHVLSGIQVADRLASGDRIRRVTIKETVHFHDYQRY
jgi:cyclophilin family peptidyl-prolyl cis-trans isomerase/HEAT repeat protein